MLKRDYCDCNTTLVMIYIRQKLPWTLRSFVNYKSTTRGVGCIFAEMASSRPLFPGATNVEQLNIIFKVWRVYWHAFMVANGLWLDLGNAHPREVAGSGRIARVPSPWVWQLQTAGFCHLSTPVCMYICLHVCMHASSCMSVCICMYVCMCMFLCSLILVCMHVYGFVCMCMYVWICMHMYVCIWCSRIHVCMHIFDCSSTQNGPGGLRSRACIAAIPATYAHFRGRCHAPPLLQGARSRRAYHCPRYVLHSLPLITSVHTIRCTDKYVTHPLKMVNYECNH